MEWWQILIGVVAIIVIAAIIVLTWWISTANRLKQGIVKIEEASSDIEVALTKRYDTLTKMLDVAKGYAKYEKEIILETISLRKGMNLGEISAANTEMNAAMTRINALAENYPQLRANENFKQLQVSIMDVEEHLQAARRCYNGNVSYYNRLVVTFPISIVANAGKFEKYAFFQAEKNKKQDVSMKF